MYRTRSQSKYHTPRYHLYKIVKPRLLLLLSTAHGAPSEDRNKKKIGARLASFVVFNGGLLRVGLSVGFSFVAE